MIDLSNQSFTKKDFSGQDLKGAVMHHSTFSCCNFNNANLTDADCSYSRFAGSTMIDTICRRTNFANAKMNMIFRPADALGMTLTLQCDTFRGMIVSAFWWYCWQQFSLLMVCEKDSDGADPKEALIQAIGLNKYLALKRMFREREL